MELSDFVTAGITTCIGLLGFDGVTRHPLGLLAKARALTAEGISAFMLVGSYEVPFKTITGDITTDLVVVPEVLGVGEVAISDRRGSQIDSQALVQIAAAAYRGGLLSGKSAVVNVHVGVGQAGITPIIEAVRGAEIEARQFLPTHMNRVPHLLEQAVELVKLGGNVDFSTGPQGAERQRASEAALRLHDWGVSFDRITFSTDANGVYPTLDADGKIVELRRWSNTTLWGEARQLIVDHGVPPEQALKPVTANPARIYRLATKGRVDAGSDADLLVMHPDWTVRSVFTRGRLMVSEGELLVRDTFER